tara:strand:- start:483 stop:905 length:423 start_codon:yes stop_codon:yes gene_type:complete
VKNQKGILVATSILKSEDEILILKRSEKVGSFQGHWSGCSGYVEENETPKETSLKEIKEETGISEEHLKLLVDENIHKIEKATGIWVVHSYLYETKTRKVRLDWENDEYEWITVDELKKYKIVPSLDKIVKDLFKRYNKK